MFQMTKHQQFHQDLILIFYLRWGQLVATYPWVVICTTFTITTLLSLGFLFFRSVLVRKYLVYLTEIFQSSICDG